MTRKRRRLVVVLVCAVGLGSAAALTLSAFSDNLVFFVSPSDLAKATPTSRQMRLGGLVQQGSVERSSGGVAGARFKVTDGSASVPVVYKGILPDLFREGQGVVVLGTEQADGVFRASEVLAKHDETYMLFRASEVLAKHDETYMPKEVAEALKKSGRWNPANGSPPPASTWNEPARASQPPG